MPNYRRALVPGARWFFTVNLFDRNSRLLVEHIGILRDSVRHTKQRHPFHIDAMVVLPNHMHAVWTLPEEDSDFSNALASHQGRLLEIHPERRMAHQMPAGAR